ncbi:L,D-transpeptidase family protein [Parasulfitobacter algicola]|uniref:L,D-transpeptidase family protein n=1 Tax=Parasulfitobacter algicola TaxID=2614809 RepID=A0ABX2IMI4_9RHOB|nr:L,D-transpeptidase family protein [Sulfitobacter algicola]NSX53555.1 L,D-transpeptidase family protein [Sulfitobacter algicola]
MQYFRLIFLVFIVAAVSGCANKFKTYNGPEVTQLYVLKSERKLVLMHHDTVLEQYEIDLGFAPDGDKKIEGDGRTPEGDYFIDRRNPNSDFHLSIGISYPNEYDIAEAKALGQPPGGDIFIHGRGPIYRKAGADWTWGCIAVTDREMERIYAMVQDGTPITILP